MTSSASSSSSAPFTSLSSLDHLDSRPGEGVEELTNEAGPSKFSEPKPSGESEASAKKTQQFALDTDPIASLTEIQEEPSPFATIPSIQPSPLQPAEIHSDSPPSTVLPGSLEQEGQDPQPSVLLPAPLPTEDSPQPVLPSLGQGIDPSDPPVVQPPLPPDAKPPPEPQPPQAELPADETSTELAKSKGDEGRDRVEEGMPSVIEAAAQTSRNEEDGQRANGTAEVREVYSAPQAIVEESLLRNDAEFEASPEAPVIKSLGSDAEGSNISASAPDQIDKPIEAQAGAIDAGHNNAGSEIDTTATVTQDEGSITAASHDQPSPAKDAIPPSAGEGSVQSSMQPSMPREEVLAIEAVADQKGLQVQSSSSVHETDASPESQDVSATDPPANVEMSVVPPPTAVIEKDPSPHTSQASGESFPAAIASNLPTEAQGVPVGLATSVEAIPTTTLEEPADPLSDSGSGKESDLKSAPNEPSLTSVETDPIVSNATTSDEPMPAAVPKPDEDKDKASTEPSGQASVDKDISSSESSTLSREETRVSLVLSVNKELIRLCVNLQSKEISETPPDVMLRDISHRLQTNLAFLASMADKSRRPGSEVVNLAIPRLDGFPHPSYHPELQKFSPNSTLPKLYLQMAKAFEGLSRPIAPGFPGGASGMPLGPAIPAPSSERKHSRDESVEAARKKHTLPNGNPFPRTSASPAPGSSVGFANPFANGASPAATPPIKGSPSSVTSVSHAPHPSVAMTPGPERPATPTSNPLPPGMSPQQAQMLLQAFGPNALRDFVFLQSYLRSPQCKPQFAALPLPVQMQQIAGLPQQQKQRMAMAVSQQRQHQSLPQPHPTESPLGHGSQRIPSGSSQVSDSHRQASFHPSSASPSLGNSRSSPGSGSMPPPSHPQGGLASMQSPHHQNVVLPNGFPQHSTQAQAQEQRQASADLGRSSPASIGRGGGTSASSPSGMLRQSFGAGSAPTPPASGLTQVFNPFAATGHAGGAGSQGGTAPGSMLPPNGSMGFNSPAVHAIGNTNPNMSGAMMMAMTQQLQAQQQQQQQQQQQGTTVFANMTPQGLLAQQQQQQQQDQRSLSQVPLMASGGGDGSSNYQQLAQILSQSQQHQQAAAVMNQHSMNNVRPPTSSSSSSSSSNPMNNNGALTSHSSLNGTGVVGGGGGGGGGSNGTTTGFESLPLHMQQFLVQQQMQQQHHRQQQQQQQPQQQQPPPPQQQPQQRQPSGSHTGMMGGGTVGGGINWSSAGAGGGGSNITPSPQQQQQPWYVNGGGGGGGGGSNSPVPGGGTGGGVGNNGFDASTLMMLNHHSQPSRLGAGGGGGGGGGFGDAGLGGGINPQQLSSISSSSSGGGGSHGGDINMGVRNHLDWSQQTLWNNDGNGNNNSSSSDIQG